LAHPATAQNPASGPQGTRASSLLLEVLWNHVDFAVSELAEQVKPLKSIKTST